jgi:hypothetical protein
MAREATCVPAGTLQTDWRVLVTGPPGDTVTRRAAMRRLTGICVPIGTHRVLRGTSDRPDMSPLAAERLPCHPTYFQ